MKTILLFFVICYAGLSALTPSLEYQKQKPSDPDLFLSGLTHNQKKSCDAEKADNVGAYSALVNNSINILDYELATDQGIRNSLEKFNNERIVTSLKENFKICDTNIAYTIIKHLFADAFNNGITSFATQIGFVDEYKIDPIPTNFSNNSDSLIDSFFTGLKILWQIIWVIGVIYVSYHGVTYLTKKGVGDEYLSDETTKNQQGNTFTNSSKILIAITATAPVFAGYSFLHIALLLIVVSAIALSNVFYMLFAFSIYEGVNKIDITTQPLSAVADTNQQSSRTRVSQFIQPILNKRICDSIIEGFSKKSDPKNKGGWDVVRSKCGYAEYDKSANTFLKPRHEVIEDTKNTDTYLPNHFINYVNGRSPLTTIIPNLKKPKFIIDYIKNSLNSAGKPLISNDSRKQGSLYIELFKATIINNRHFKSAITSKFNNTIDKKVTYECAKNLYNDIYSSATEWYHTSATKTEIFNNYMTNKPNGTALQGACKLTQAISTNRDKFENYINDSKNPILLDKERNKQYFEQAFTDISDIASAFVSAYEQLNPALGVSSTLYESSKLNAVINRGFLSAHDLVFRTNTFRDSYLKEVQDVQKSKVSDGAKKLYRDLFDSFPVPGSNSEVINIASPSPKLPSINTIDDIYMKLKSFEGFEPFYIKSKNQNPLGNAASRRTTPTPPASPTPQVEDPYIYFEESPLISRFFECKVNDQHVSFDRYPVPFVLTHCAKGSLEVYLVAAEASVYFKSFFATIKILMNRLALNNKNTRIAEINDKRAKKNKPPMQTSFFSGGPAKWLIKNDSVLGKNHDIIDKFAGAGGKFTGSILDTNKASGLKYIIGLGGANGAGIMTQLIKQVFEFLKLLLFMFIFFIIVTAMFLLLAPFAIYLYSLITAFLSWLANTFVYFITWPIQFIRSASDTHSDEEGLHKAALNQLFMPTMIVFSLSLSLIIMYAGLFIFSELYSELLQILSTNFNIDQINSFDHIIAFAAMSIWEIITNLNFAESIASILFTALIPVLLLVTIVSKSIAMSDSLLSKLASVAGLRYRPELTPSPITIAVMAQQVLQNNASQMSAYIGGLRGDISGFNQSHSDMRTKERMNELFVDNEENLEIMHNPENHSDQLNTKSDADKVFTDKIKDASGELKKSDFDDWRATRDNDMIKNGSLTLEQLFIAEQAKKMTDDKLNKLISTDFGIKNLYNDYAINDTGDGLVQTEDSVIQLDGLKTEVQKLEASIHSLRNDLSRNQSAGETEKINLINNEIAAYEIELETKHKFLENAKKEIEEISKPGAIDVVTIRKELEDWKHDLSNKGLSYSVSNAALNRNDGLADDALNEELRLANASKVVGSDKTLNDIWNSYRGGQLKFLEMTSRVFNGLPNKTINIINKFINK